VNYYGKNLISKESLAEYLASYDGQRITRLSQSHRETLEAFIDRGQESGSPKMLTLTNMQSVLSLAITGIGLFLTANKSLFFIYKGEGSVG